MTRVAILILAMLMWLPTLSAAQNACGAGHLLTLNADGTFDAVYVDRATGKEVRRFPQRPGLAVPRPPQ